MSEIIRKLYISPTGKDKFGFNTYFTTEPPQEEVYVEATQEMIDELKNHTLCWSGGEVVPYKKTAAEIMVDEAKIKRQKAQREIFELKSKLRDSDYKAIKYAEGEMTAEEFEPVKTERRAWRAKINELELLLKE